MLDKIKSFIGFILLLIMGIYFLIGATYVFYKQWKTLRFKEIEGEVVLSGIGEKLHTRGRGMGAYCVYYPKIVYQYKVDNLLYTNDVYKLISFFGTGKSNISYAEKIISKFPSGGKCKVYYNPTNPKEACLIKELDSILIFFFFTISGICVGIALRESLKIKKSKIL